MSGKFGKAYNPTLCQLLNSSKFILIAYNLELLHIRPMSCRTVKETQVDLIVNLVLLDSWEIQTLSAFGVNARYQTQRTTLHLTVSV